MERKSILHDVLPETSQINKIRYIETAGTALHNMIEANNLEGTVAKRKDSRYVGKRSLKIGSKVINYQYADIFLTGLRKGDFGWLASVQEASGRFRPAGVIEFGVPPAHKQAFREISKQLFSGEDKYFVYLDPRLKATVKFRNWTRSGMLRSPVFVDFVYTG